MKKSGKWHKSSFSVIDFLFWDKLLELQDYPGMQVHRSWWVAFAAIDRVKKQGRKTILVMNNGIEVPVSRKYQASVREKGF
ncbi:MAG TPA: LytTR family transcriptional regulator [Oceanospirillales bacterium]|nr:LytTR family transcriptional regulator [Oceanospirillales bacterium]